MNATGVTRAASASTPQPQSFNDQAGTLPQFAPTSHQNVNNMQEMDHLGDNDSDSEIRDNPIPFAQPVTNNESNQQTFSEASEEKTRSTRGAGTDIIAGVDLDQVNKRMQNIRSRMETCLSGKM